MMNELTSCTNNANDGAQWPALSSGIRELSSQELAMASGGLPFLIPPIIATGVKWGGAIFVGTIIGRAATTVYDEFLNPTTSCQM